MRRFDFTSYGVNVSILWVGEIEDSSWKSVLDSVLPPVFTGSTPASDSHLVKVCQSRDAWYVISSEDGPEARNSVMPAYSFASFIFILNRAVSKLIAVHAPDLSFVHAGAVALRGNAILFPGLSFAGKSTLVKAMVEAGCEYLSDDYAPLDVDGKVHPYPRPISMRTENGRQEIVMSSPAGFTRYKVAVVADIRFSEAARRLEIHDVGASEAAMSLIANSLAARFSSKRVVAAASAAARNARCLQGIRGDAGEAAARLVELLDGCS